MAELKDFFQDEYQFALKKCTFDFDDSQCGGESELKVEDKISTQNSENQLVVTFERNVYFEPRIFDIYVKFDIIMYYNEGMGAEGAEIDWASELLNNQNPYITNIASRASLIISSITSAYGQQPLVTPPSPVIQQA